LFVITIAILLAKNVEEFTTGSKEQTHRLRPSSLIVWLARTHFGLKL